MASSPFYRGMTVGIMDGVNEPDKRATRLEDFFGGGGDMADFEVPSPNIIPAEGDPSSSQSTSDKKAKTLHGTPPHPKAPQALKLSKRVAFAGLPVIVENQETVAGPKEHVEHKEVAASQLHDPSKSSPLSRHFEAYYKIQLGRNEDIPVCRIKPAAFEENPAVLDQKLTSVLLWTLSGSDDRVPNKSEDQVKIVHAIVSEKFVKGIGGYEMPKRGVFTIVYEFMPVSLADVAASRKVRGSELAYILKQILGGLLYLEGRDMGNAELDCSNVLLDTSGEVKIWGQHFCSSGTADNLVAGFWRITVELMNGYVKEDVRGDHLDYAKWTAYPEAVDFYKCLETLNNATSDGVRLSPTKSSTGRSRFETIKKVREEPFHMMCAWSGVS
ncbi:hypothetical protein FPOA_12391 [Fusarium poae]|uniref:Protein kinase domain-containing protein n=1 Tax=Fusarium poae TaxID=36050 RepID=A0A1B8A9A7_FUSPO|nr:hypothetical protein FPOA_12396 [Fusarium poae]OBS17118.1 hypothetical protein FPOA_12391 [Fusarium poae]